jgi:hypothetical protein
MQQLSSQDHGLWLLLEAQTAEDRYEPSASNLRICRALADSGLSPTLGHPCSPRMDRLDSAARDLSRIRYRRRV